MMLNRYVNLCKLFGICRKAVVTMLQGYNYTVNAMAFQTLEGIKLIEKKFANKAAILGNLCVVRI